MVRKVLARTLGAVLLMAIGGAGAATLGTVYLLGMAERAKAGTRP